jgi:predicted chitinase
MVNINFNMGPQAGFGGGGGFPMGGAMPAALGGCGAGMPGGFPGMGLAGMGGGFPGMSAMGGGFPGMNAMGGGCDPMQQMMMSAMGMMSMAMMALMTRMMAQQVAMLGQSAFGGAMGGGNPQGSPLGNFLGGGQAGGAGAPGGAGGANGSSGATGPTASGPAGKVGNVNVEKLVNAIPESYRPYARKSWPAIVAEAQKEGVTNKAQLAYILATTVHESGAGKYMEELASGSAYEGRSDLGNTHSGDGVRYKGRGYVQITGRNNYTNWSKKLGIDLVGNPELAERPEIAAQILVRGMKEGSFTGKKLDDYINGSHTDFTGARRIVNGTDKAGTFAATAQAILKAMG